MREIIFGSSLALVVAFAALAAAAWPVPGRPTAVFFRSDVSPADMVAAVQRSGGLLLEADATASMVISISDQSNYVTSLYRAGAVFVISASLARLCFNRSGGRQP